LKSDPPFRCTTPIGTGENLSGRCSKGRDKRFNSHPGTPEKEDATIARMSYFYLFRQIAAGDTNVGITPFCGEKKKGPATSYSPTKKFRSTIGAEELNDRVRDGNGCGLLAIVTGPEGQSIPQSGIERI
jgi:hypothetical protein